MPQVWAIIVTVVLLLVIYAMVSSRISARRRLKAREKALPYVDDAIRPGKRYDLQLSDGRRFNGVQILGTTDPKDGQFPLGGGEGLLVLKLDDGRKAYIRQTSVRCVIEA